MIIDEIKFTLKIRWILKLLFKNKKDGGSNFSYLKTIP